MFQQEKYIAALTEKARENFKSFGEKVVTEQIGPILFKAEEEDIDLSEGWEGRVNEKERYLLKIFFTYADLQAAIGKTMLCEAMLDVAEIPEPYTEQKITEINYYRYHYEYFHLATSTLLDLAAHMTNYGMKLGYKPFDCKIGSLLSNTNVAGTSIGVKLSAFDKKYNDLKRHRNAIIHRGDFKPSNLVEIELAEYLEKWFSLDQEKIAKMSKRKNDGIQDLRNEVHKVTSEIYTEISDILAELIPHVEAQVKIFDLSDPE
jgi:hypothetical protein